MGIERKVYTVKEVAALLNLHPAVVGRKIKSGIIKAANLGRGCVRIPVTEVERLLAVRDDDNG